MTAQPESLHTITLDQPGRMAVFTEDGRVFYDLSFLAATLTHDVMRAHDVMLGVAGLTEDERAEMPDTLKAYLLGQSDLITNIYSQAEGMTMNYKMANMVGVEDLINACNTKD